MTACENLDAYVDGELDAEQHAEFEVHLATCDACIAELPGLLALMAALDGAASSAASPRLALVGDPDAASAARAEPVPVEPVRRPPAKSRRPWWVNASVGAGLAAAAVFAVILWRPPVDRPALVALQSQLGPTRNLEARLSYPGTEGYRKADALRGARGAEPISLDTMVALERAKDWHGLAVASLLAGQRDRATQLFAQAPRGPHVDADRAALELVDGSPPALERALDNVDRALAAAPDDGPARWNRALVLAALGLEGAAAAEFDRVAALGEPGWADEARGRAQGHRASLVAREGRWRKAYDAGRRLVEDGSPVPTDLAAVAGTLTVSFYDAVRSAPSRERAMALLPLAQELDRAYRSDRLAAYVQRVAASDFRIRKPLADSYHQLALRRLSPKDVDALLARLERPGAEDLRLGALFHAGAIAAHLDEYRRLAAASQDPWFAVIAAHEAARAERDRDATASAERQLRDALGLAQRERLAYRALLIEDDLIKLYNKTLRLSHAADETQAAYRNAMSAGEWGLEMGALIDLAAVDQNRYAIGLVRAHLDELVVRLERGLWTGYLAARDCARKAYAHESLANVALFQFDPVRARAEAIRAPRCPGEPSLLAPEIWTELFRLEHRDEDARKAAESLAALRAVPPSYPGQDALVTYVEGNLALLTDRAAGRRLLRAAIDKAGDDAAEFAVKARAYGFSLLAIDAGRASEFADVLAIVAETTGVPRPQRCAIAVAVQDERSVVAFADARGETGGQFATRASPALDAQALVPRDIVDRLRSCERVAVLARAPVLGAARVLPPDLAWHYVVKGARSPSPSPSPSPSAGGRRLVVADPVIPPGLSLPPLAAPPDAAGDASVTVLRGADATPSRVLLAMRDAAVIELHTHGFLANDVSEASYLVLSPELDQQYALTARDVAGVELTRAPLVILGACHAAASSRSLEGGIGLPEAFRRSGASAVIASPDPVQDLGAQAFFTAVRQRIAAGTDPAVAVRDERQVRGDPLSGQGNAWVAGVVVFE